jgi:four helix bundle protein
LTRAADSIGANIAEAYGRFHYCEKLQIQYFSRGSLFETKYLINPTTVRKFLPEQQVKKYSNDLSQLAHQLNTFAKKTKAQNMQKRNLALSASLKSNINLWKHLMNFNSSLKMRNYFPLMKSKLSK